MAVDDLAASRNQGQEVRNATVVDERLHRRADAGQAVGIETQFGGVAERQGEV